VVSGPVASQVGQESTLDFFHDRTSVVAKFGAPDFTSREVRKETDEELTEIMTKSENKIPSYEETLKSRR
jgi:hypothetical protein